MTGNTTDTDTKTTTTPVASAERPCTTEPSFGDIVWALPGALWRWRRRKKSGGRTIPPARTEYDRFVADQWAEKCKATYRSPSVYSKVAYSEKLDELRRQVSAYQQELVQLNEDLVRVRRRNVELEADDIRDRMYNDINQED